MYLQCIWYQEVRSCCMFSETPCICIVNFIHVLLDDFKFRTCSQFHAFITFISNYYLLFSVISKMVLLLLTDSQNNVHYYNLNTEPPKQGSKLTLVRWPVASGFPVGPVESVLHWPGWPVKFKNPTFEFTWFLVNFNYRIKQYTCFN